MSLKQLLKKKLMKLRCSVVSNKAENFEFIPASVQVDCELQRSHDSHKNVN